MNPANPQLTGIPAKGANKNFTPKAFGVNYIIVTDQPIGKARHAPLERNASWKIEVVGFDGK